MVAEGGLSLSFFSLSSFSIKRRAWRVASESRVWNAVGAALPLTNFVFRAKHVERENHKTERTALELGETRLASRDQETFFRELDEPRDAKVTYVVMYRVERKRLSLCWTQTGSCAETEKRVTDRTSE